MWECILVTASWCKACVPMKEYWGRCERSGVEFKIIDAEELPKELLHICSLPTVVIRYNGETVVEENGVKTMEQIMETLKQAGA